MGRGRLRQGHDQLGDFCHAVEAEFDGEVSAGDHDAEVFVAHAGHEDLGEAFVAWDGLNFEDESEAFDGCWVSDVGECLEEVFHIGDVSDEGDGCDVGVLDNKAQVLKVFFSEAWEWKFGVWEVDSLVCGQVYALWAGVGDFQFYVVVSVGGGGLVDADCGDGSVVEKHAVPDFNCIDCLWKGAADAWCAAGSEDGS